MNIHHNTHKPISERFLPLPDVHVRMCARVRHLEHELEDEIRGELGDSELAEEV